VEGFASYTWLDYLHPSSFPDPDSVEIRKQYGLDTHDRDDDLLRIDITVDRPITNSTSLSARYTYFNSASNADAFDYQRHVVGLYATMQFAP
jgi:ABC-type sulfate transport system substrate-binding protein